MHVSLFDVVVDVVWFSIACQSNSSTPAKCLRGLLCARDCWFGCWL